MKKVKRKVRRDRRLLKALIRADRLSVCRRESRLPETKYPAAAEALLARWEIERSAEYHSR